MKASELRINHIATRDCAMPLRHALGAFLQALGLESFFCFDVIAAAGEALANSLEHAYAECEPGMVELYACEENAQELIVAVHDDGNFTLHDRNPERGFGLPIMHALAGAVSIETENGTRVQMLFDTSCKHSSVVAYDAVAY
jgi:anti-sigma regulatory factor (Ser/Thr protein kinase)